MARRGFASSKATTPKEWADIESFFVGKMGVPESVRQAEEASKKAGLPNASVPASLGMLLRQLAHGHARVLEVGTLGGVSALWLCDDGRRQVTTVDISAANAALAQQAFDRARVSRHIQVLVGDARTLVPALPAQSFDFMFVDADKASNDVYVRAGVEGLVRPGGRIVVDNVVRAGSVVEGGNEAERGVRRLLDYLQSCAPRLSWTVIQTVGPKGHDGFCVIQLKD